MSHVREEIIEVWGQGLGSTVADHDCLRSEV